MNAFNNPGLAGNPHFIDVTVLTDPLERQTSAILTLAYEQRTASLIAWLTYVQPKAITGSPEAKEIAERMGL